MQQNPYCSRCLNSLTISQNNKGESIGICDKCRTIKILSVKEKENYSHNEKCKKLCDCNGLAYVHGNNDFYECLCCFKKIPLSGDTVTHLKNKKNNEPKPQLSDVHGKRFLIIQEPEYEDHIYCGVMKECQGHGLF